MMDDFNQSILRNYVIRMGKSGISIIWRAAFCFLQLYFLLLQHVTQNLVVVYDNEKPLLRLIYQQGRI